MNKPQQTIAIAICGLGLLVVAIGAAVLLSELKKERDRREGLEAEVTQLRTEIETLRTHEERVRMIRKAIDRSRLTQLKGTRCALSDEQE